MFLCLFLNVFLYCCCQLEQRQKIEMEELRQRLEKEHEARLGFDARELELDIQRQVKEKERHDKFAALNENKRRKHIMQMQEQEMKQLLQQQKKDYQRSKEEMRKVRPASTAVHCYTLVLCHWSLRGPRWEDEKLMLGCNLC